MRIIPFPNRVLKSYSFLGYVKTGYGGSLGVRRSGGRQPLHDPEAEGALVLYRPAVISQHDKLTVSIFVREAILQFLETEYSRVYK